VQHPPSTGVGTFEQPYRLLRAVLNTAADDELIARNPCRIKGAGVEGTPERPVITLAQVLALAAAVPPRYRALVLLAVFASMRWGELIGLRRGDLDLEQASVSIERSAVEIGTRIVIKPPKTAAGVRSVALPVWLVPELRQHLDTFAEPGPDGRVFLGQYGATPLRRNFATIWKRAKSSAGLPDGLHFHDLRHAGNHFAAASGANTRELMGRMGHASMRAALIYQHRTAERDRAIAEALDMMLKAGE
jgi:integrase